MAKYTVLALKHNEVVKDEDGEKYVVRYVKGDTVEIPAAKAERLVRTGGLALQEDVAETLEEAVAEVVEVAPAALSGQTVEPIAPVGTNDGAESDGDDDEYTDMGYSDLQSAAKDAGLNAGGSAEDLRARLRENDTE